MKLMIDISKDRYDEIMSMDWKNCRLLFAEELRAIHDGKALEQEPCDDCISREAALDDSGLGEFHRYDDYVKMRNYLKSLPSVTPQPKWILCKDRMPDYHQLVLTFDGEYICVEQRIPYIIGENGKHIESEWWVDVNYVQDSELYSGLREGAAEAWMPMPTPPKMSEIPTGAESDG